LLLNELQNNKEGDAKIAPTDSHLIPLRPSRPLLPLDAQPIPIIQCRQYDERLGHPGLLASTARNEYKSTKPAWKVRGPRAPLQCKNLLGC